MKTIKLTLFFLLVTIKFYGNTRVSSSWNTAQPLLFEENKGQIIDDKGNNSSILFRTNDMDPNKRIYIAKTGFIYFFLEKVPTAENEIAQYVWNRIDVNFGNNANLSLENAVKSEIANSRSNYFYAHCPNGVTNVEKAGTVLFKNVWPGIDLKCYNYGSKGFKYDFIVHPGADPNIIKLEYSSLNPVSIDDKGNIQATTNIASLTENTPISFQNGKPLKTHFVKRTHPNTKGGYDTDITFDIEAFNTADKLVIDPEITWGTFIGSHERDYVEHVTSFGNKTYVYGNTMSVDFPTVNNGGYYNDTLAQGEDLFLMTFDQQNQLIHSTYYGGTRRDDASTMVTDSKGNVYLCGETTSTDFPIKDAGTYIDTLGPTGLIISLSEIFILKFTPDHELTWATFIGGPDSEIDAKITCDKDDNIYLIGNTLSDTLIPLMDKGGYYQDTYGGDNSFFFKIYGDAFITQFDSLGNQVWGTYFGGSTSELIRSLTVDGDGNLIVIGEMNGLAPEFPLVDAGTYFQNTFEGTVNVAAYFGLGGGDGYITKFNPAGDITWSTLFGGNADEFMSDVTTDSDNNIYIAGTVSNVITGEAFVTFPTQNIGGYYQPTMGDDADAFVASFTNTGDQLWSTFIGGDRKETMYSLNSSIEIDSCNQIYLGFIIDGNTSTLPYQVQSCDSGYYDTLSLNTNLLHNDMYIARFSSDREVNWGSFIGGSMNEGLSGLHLTDNHELFVSGYVQGIHGITTPFDTASYDHLLVASGTSYLDDAIASDEGLLLKFENVPNITTGATTLYSNCGCLGSAFVNISNNSCSGTSYSWRDSLGTLISTNDSVENLCVGVYMVNITQPCGFDTTIEVSVGDSTIRRNTSYAICDGDSVLINGSWYNSPLLFGDTIRTVSGCDSIIETVSLTVATYADSSITHVICDGDSIFLENQWQLDEGTYVDTIKDAMECPLFGITSTVAFAESPIINIESSADTCFNNTGAITLTLNPGSSVQWKNNSTQENLTDLSAGNYTATVSDSANCLFDLSTDIGSYNIECVEVPNVISPNGDGINETLFISNIEDYPNNKLVVFNRWGKIVYETTGYANDWSGDNLVEGTYFYVLDINDDSGEVAKGSFSIVR